MVYWCVFDSFAKQNEGNNHSPRKRQHFDKDLKHQFAFSQLTQFYAFIRLFPLIVHVRRLFLLLSDCQLFYPSFHVVTIGLKPFSPCCLVISNLILHFWFINCGFIFLIFLPCRSPFYEQQCISLCIQF